MCAHCNDTGSLSKDLEGHLDCAYCDVAEQRAKFNRWAATVRERGAAAMWIAFQHGRAEAPATIN